MLNNQMVWDFASCTIQWQIIQVRRSAFCHVLPSAAGLWPSWLIMGKKNMVIRVGKNQINQHLGSSRQDSRTCLKYDIGSTQKRPFPLFRSGGFHFFRCGSSQQLSIVNHTIWLFNIAMENPLYMEVLVGKSSINGSFSIAMLNKQRVRLNNVKGSNFGRLLLNNGGFPAKSRFQGADPKIGGLPKTWPIWNIPTVNPPSAKKRDMFMLTILSCIMFTMSSSFLGTFRGSRYMTGKNNDLKCHEDALKKVRLFPESVSCFSCGLGTKMAERVYWVYCLIFSVWAIQKKGRNRSPIPLWYDYDYDHMDSQLINFKYCSSPRRSNHTDDEQWSRPGRRVFWGDKVWLTSAMDPKAPV